MVVQAFKLNLPRSALAPAIMSSVLFEPHSNSLAIMHPDSSFSLYPSVSPLSVPPPPPPLPTYIPSPTSSSTFLLLRRSNENPLVVFIVAAPHNGGAAVLLRFWVLQNSRVFGRPHVLCTQRDIAYHEKLGVVMNDRHDVSLTISGSVNYFVMHSGLKSKISVFGLKVAERDDAAEVSFKLMKCAVINCECPIWSISMSFVFLVLGEENGIRVLPLHYIVKDRARKRGGNKGSNHVKVIAHGSQGPNLVNGLIEEDGGVGHERLNEVNKVMPFNISMERLHHHSTVISSSEKHEERDLQNTCFVAFDAKIDASSKSEAQMKPVRARSIQSFSKNQFMVLDSAGYLHLLCISNLESGPGNSYCMKRLLSVANMQKITIFPDISSDTQTIWMSDGMRSVHRFVLAKTHTPASENDHNSNEILPQLSGNIH